MNVPLPKVRRAVGLVLGLLCFTATLLSSRALAADPEVRTFDVPPGAASLTLKQFAAQAGREIVFADSVGNVQTRPVQGTLTPRQALDAMLADTGLVSSEDAKTGALAVRRPVAAPPEKKSDKITAPATDADTPVKLATFVVTGSNIPTAADSTDAPVVIIGRQDIEQTGLNANLLQILRESIPAFAGRSNSGVSNATNVNQNTAGGSQIALHNLDTLILLNGRRIAMSGINATGGKNFVDINQIPVAAIDHMEVLTDGASAIYGSDAIGGVVNIILKSNYEGAELGGRYAVSTNT